MTVYRIIWDSYPNNRGDLVNMKKSIFAALFRCASPEKNNWHDHCPKGKDSWCKFLQDAVNATNKYIPGAGLQLSGFTC